jgi:uracil-DNA glycosylase
VLVALGRIAFDASLRMFAPRHPLPRPRPQFAHGSIARLPGGYALIGCYHPSRQNTNTGKLTPSMLDTVFRKAARELARSNR